MKHFETENTTGHKKGKSRSKKAIPLQSISENGSDKLPTIGASVKAKYDGQWFTGELVAYNKEIDQWTIYFKKMIILIMSYFQIKTSQFNKLY